MIDQDWTDLFERELNLAEKTRLWCKRTLAMRANYHQFAELVRLSRLGLQWLDEQKEKKHG